MVIDMGGEHIGVSYGKIKRTPGQLDCERAREIFEGVQPQAVRIGLTVAEDIDEISENLREAMPDVLHLSGDIEGISPAEVAELKSRFPELKIMQAIPVLAGVPLDEQKVMQYVKDYEPVSDFFLIDTKAPAAGDIGATGLTHDRAIDGPSSRPPTCRASSPAVWTPPMWPRRFMPRTRMASTRSP